MIDQAWKLRKLAGPMGPGPATYGPATPSLAGVGTAIAKSASAGPRIIAITSGKGGVGKTNLTVNIALSLAKMGKRVVILDADMGMANAEVLLDLIPRFTLYEVINGLKTLDEVMIQGPFGLNIISGGSGFQELADLDSTRREALLKSLAGLDDKADFVFIDTGAGISKSVLGFVATAQEVIVVVTPEPTSITDAYALIKVLSKYKTHTEVGLIVNRVTGQREAAQTINKIKAVAAKFLNITIKSIGSVAEDKAIRQAVTAQNPLVIMQPWAVAAQNIDNISKALIDKCEPAPERGMTSFVSKLLRLFG